MFLLLQEGTIQNFPYPSIEEVYKWLRESSKLNDNLALFRSRLNDWLDNQSFKYLEKINTNRNEDNNVGYVVEGYFDQKNKTIVLNIPYKVSPKDLYKPVWRTLVHEIIHAIQAELSDGNKALKQTYYNHSSVDPLRSTKSLPQRTVEDIRYFIQEFESNNQVFVIAYEIAELARQNPSKYLNMSLEDASEEVGNNMFSRVLSLVDFLLSPNKPDSVIKIPKPILLQLKKHKQKAERRYYEILMNLYNNAFKGKEMRTEGKKQAKDILTKHFGTDETFNRILEIDPTPSKKYTEWIAKQIVRNAEKYSNQNELEGLGYLLHEFWNLSKRGQIPSEFTDINRIKTDEQLLQIVQKASSNKQVRDKYRSQEEEIIRNKESDIIEETNQYIVVKPITHKSWCYWVPNLWCTSHDSDNSRQVVQMHDQVGINVIVLIDKTKEDSDRMKHIAFGVYPETTRIPKGEDLERMIQQRQDQLRDMGFDEEEFLGHFSQYDIPEGLEWAKYEITYGDNKHASLRATADSVVELLQPYYDFPIKKEWFE